MTVDRTVSSSPAGTSSQGTQDRLGTKGALEESLPGPLYLHNRGFEDLAKPFLKAGVLRDADVALVDAVAPRWGEGRPDVLLALALAVRAPRAGHVGVDLQRVRDRVSAEAQGRRGATTGDGEEDPAAALAALPWPAPGAWQAATLGSPLVGDHEVAAPQATPFVVQRVGGGRALVMTRRMSHEQHRVAEALTTLAGGRPAFSFPEEAMEAEVAALYGTGRSSQAAQAARRVCRAPLTLITGGPGTGKTYSIARTLLVLLGLHAQHTPSAPSAGGQEAASGDGPEGADGASGSPRPLRVALAAPTGKAAVRMREAIVEHLQQLGHLDDLDDLDQAEHVAATLETMTSRTLHSLLGVRREGGVWRDRSRPLEADVVVVDEASMIDLVLMRMLVEAVPAGARLVLLGDPDQLASVEAGTVLADLLQGAAPGRRLAGANVAFTHNYRSEEAPRVAAVADLIREAARQPDAGGLAARTLRGMAVELLQGEAPTLPSEELGIGEVAALVARAQGDALQRVRPVRLKPEDDAAPPASQNPGLARWVDGAPRPNARGAQGVRWAGALSGCLAAPDGAGAPAGGAGSPVSALGAAAAFHAVDGSTIVERVRSVLREDRPLEWKLVLDAMTLPYLGAGAYVQALLGVVWERRQRGEAPLSRWSDQEARWVLDALGAYRVLGVHRKGRRGVSGLNEGLRARVKGLVTHGVKEVAGADVEKLERAGHWLGEVVLVTRNAYDVDLRNGDVGLVLPGSRAGRLAAWFPQGAREVQELPLVRLPPHAPGLAMTVHKSQGSQFRRVALVLASQASALQSRELVYTALTRAQRCIDWYGEQAVLAEALARPIERASGLGDLLR